MVVFDSTVMLLLLYPTAQPPIDPNTNMPLDFAKERIETLIKTLSKEKTRVVIPTPVLSEILVRTGGATSKYLDEITSNHIFQVGEFDLRAAVEVAALSDKQTSTGNKKHSDIETWAKIKYDRQIVAVAKVHGVDRIYSDDKGVYKVAQSMGIKVIRTWELPVSPESRQGKLALSPADEKSGEP